MGRVFKFLYALPIAFTNLNRKIQNLPSIANDSKGRLARCERLYNPGFTTSIIESAPVSRIGEINKAFVEPVDFLGVELEEKCRVLVCASLAVIDSIHVALRDKDNSITRDLFPSSDIFLTAHFIQQERGASALRIIQQRIRSFRKHQLSVGSGFHLLMSITIFAAMVIMTCLEPDNYMVSFVLPHLLFIPFGKPLNNTYSRRVSFTKTNDL